MSFLGSAGGIIGGLGQIASGLVSGHAAKKASKAQQASDQAAIAEQQRQFNETRTDLAPWRDAGQAALTAQSTLIGLNGTAGQQDAITALMASPQFSSLLGQGEEGILQNAAATGGLRGGNVNNSLARFRTDLLSQLINQQYERLGGLSSNGLTSATSTGQFGANAATNIGNFLTQQGAAKAGGILGKASGINQAIGGVTQILGSVASMGMPGAGGMGGGGAFPGFSMPTQMSGF